MTTRISIAMATYNGAAFLEEQLRSLSSQKILPQELWVSDDGSTDATLAILEKYSTTAPFPVRIEGNSKRLGYGRNFLKAALRCEAGYIAFCDQDDVWRNDKLQLVTDAIEKMSPDILVHGGIVVDHKLASLGFRHPHIQSSGWFEPTQLHEDHFWPGYALVIRRESLLSWGVDEVVADEKLCPNTFAHDRWVIEAVKRGASCFQIPDELVQYRQHTSNHIGFSGVEK